MLSSLTAVFFGSMAYGDLFYNFRNNISTFDRAAFEIIFLFFSLLLSTSYLGILFIPVLVFVKVFLMSAFIASLFLFSGSLSDCLIMEAVPAFILLPCWLVFSDDCALLSSQLFSLRFSLGHCRSVLRFKNCFVCVIFILIELFYCLYIIPRIAS